ncbi:hypothetical protein, partial [Enterococcus cecorum]|uniref:hypothetical protein n=1 Tax=Enterococcus cecorum TaxID=44008 RepID=UPI001AEBC750
VNKEKNLQSRVTLEIFNIPRYWALTITHKINDERSDYLYTHFLLETIGSALFVSYLQIHSKSLYIFIFYFSFS